MYLIGSHVSRNMKGMGSMHHQSHMSKSHKYMARGLMGGAAVGMGSHMAAQAWSERE